MSWDERHLFNTWRRSTKQKARSGNWNGASNECPTGRECWAIRLLYSIIRQLIANLAVITRFHIPINSDGPYQASGDFVRRLHEWPKGNTIFIFSESFFFLTRDQPLGKL